LNIELAWRAGRDERLAWPVSYPSSLLKTSLHRQEQRALGHPLALDTLLIPIDSEIMRRDIHSPLDKRRIVVILQWNQLHQFVTRFDDNGAFPLEKRIDASCPLGLELDHGKRIEDEPLDGLTTIHGGTAYIAPKRHLQGCHGKDIDHQERRLHDGLLT